MSEITAASIKYSEPAKISAGGVSLTSTNVEVAATTEEYVEGGIELKPESLGLTDGLVSLGGSVGATASGVSALIWCNPVIALNKETYEEAKLVSEGIVAQITMVGTKPFLRVFSIATAGIGKPFAEPKTSTKVKLGKFSVTVFAFGK